MILVSGKLNERMCFTSRIPSPHKLTWYIIIYLYTVHVVPL